MSQFWAIEDTPRSAFCSNCLKECTCILIDDSFSYPGITRNRMETHHEYHEGSDCCEAPCDDGIFVMCQCGNEIEISPEADLNFLQCDACKRAGKWMTEY